MRVPDFTISSSLRECEIYGEYRFEENVFQYSFPCTLAIRGGLPCISFTRNVSFDGVMRSTSIDWETQTIDIDSFHNAAPLRD